MRNSLHLSRATAPIALVFILIACSQSKQVPPSPESISALDLKKGALISCGPATAAFGTVSFGASSNKEIKKEFNLGVSLLHSFEYDEAEKVFASVIQKDPACAMAYWGVAMSNFHALWAPPTPAELVKGAKALEIARSISNITDREKGYINAISAFYTDAGTVDHRTRCIRFEEAMEALSKSYPDDKEASIFYALALAAASDPADKTFVKQKKAGKILNALYPGEPNHPGVVHYIIHTYDYPDLAHLGLTAARKYAAVAPSSAHALHMPSHIFTRLGLWSEMLASNLASVSSAQCYAEAAGLRGHWDEELHALDYLVYGYLQRGESGLAKKQRDYLAKMDTVTPMNVKVAYAFAAIPARYALENRLWEEAAALQPKAAVNWEKFAWQKAIIHFARLMGAVQTGKTGLATAELAALKTIHDTLTKRKEAYMANQVLIQAHTGEAWIRLKQGAPDRALELMTAAADLEDKTEKHPVTPGEVLPAKELLGDMLLEMNRPAEALTAYEASLRTHQNRFNGLYSAALAAERSGNRQKAGTYYKKLLSITNPASTRPELERARQFLDNTLTSVAGNR